MAGRRRRDHHPEGFSPVTAEDLVANLGIGDLRFSAIVPMGGASCVASLQAAAAVVAAGVCRHVLIPVGRTGYSGARIGTWLHQVPQFRIVGEFEAPQGAVAPANFYAPMARRYMELWGTTSLQFGEIAVTTRRHALLNERATMKTPITLADHQASRMISVSPARLQPGERRRGCGDRQRNRPGAGSAPAAGADRGRCRRSSR